MGNTLRPSLPLFLVVLCSGSPVPALKGPAAKKGLRQIDMRLAFVLRLGTGTRPLDSFFEGWVEEVDSCTEFRFRSTDELLKFLGQRFELTMGGVRQPCVTEAEETTPVPQANRSVKKTRRSRKTGSDL